MFQIELLSYFLKTNDLASFHIANVKKIVQHKSAHSSIVQGLFVSA